MTQATQHLITTSIDNIRYHVVALAEVQRRTENLVQNWNPAYRFPQGTTLEAIVEKMNGYLSANFKEDEYTLDVYRNSQNPAAVTGHDDECEDLLVIGINEGGLESKAIMQFSFDVNYGSDLMGITSCMYGEHYEHMMTMIGLFGHAEFYVPEADNHRIHFSEIYFHFEKGVKQSLESMDRDVYTKTHFSKLYPHMYPYLDVHKMSKLYIGCEENILMIEGPPGVGKTCLLKMILVETAKAMGMGFSAWYVKDRNVLIEPEFWTMLSKACRNGGGPKMVILDDLDHELTKREKGKDNTIVSQLLSFSNGVFPNQTKFIVTTNLSIDDVDPAIIRPGRCFDVLGLRALTRAEALSVWTDVEKLAPEEFVKSFPENTSITQAALKSEADRCNANQFRDYLTDQTVSIRKRLLANAENYRVK